MIVSYMYQLFYFVLWIIDCRFDEVHFGQFTNFFMKNQFFFDMHPPLGKLMFAFTGIVSRAKFHLSSDKGLMLKTLMVANLHLRSW